MYLPKIQELRGIAALLVTIGHLNYSIPIVSKLNLSFGVDIFFFISGFIMNHVLQNKNYTFNRFILNRIIRIYPLYLIYSIILIFISFIILSRTDTNWWMNSLLLYPFFERQWRDLILVPGWTLTFEIIFYVIISLSLLKYLKNTRFIFFGAWTIIILLVNCANEDIHPLLRIVGSNFNLEFIIGFLIYPKLKSYRSPKRTKNNLLLIISSAILIFLATNTNDSGEGMIVPRDLIYFGNSSLPRILIWGMPSLMFLIYYYTSNFRLTWIESIGKWSYSLYLMQFIFIGITQRVLSIPELTNSINSIFIYKLLTFLFLILILIILSRISFLLFEKKLTEYFQSRTTSIIVYIKDNLK